MVNGIPSNVAPAAETRSSVVPSAAGFEYPVFACVDKFSELFNLSRSKIYDMIGTGELIARRIGGRTLLNVQENLARCNSQPIVKVYRHGRSA